MGRRTTAIKTIITTIKRRSISLVSLQRRTLIAGPPLIGERTRLHDNDDDDDDGKGDSDDSHSNNNATFAMMIIIITQPSGRLRSRVWLDRRDLIPKVYDVFLRSTRSRHCPRYILSNRPRRNTSAASSARAHCFNGRNNNDNDTPYR